MSSPFSVSEELLPIERIKFRGPLAPRTLTAQVFRATIGSKDYAVKLFLPYSKEDLCRGRSRLREYNLSDDELEARFHPWRREMRVYQQIDKYIQGPDRQFFPKYYGAAKLSRKLFPRWGYMEDTEDIPVIILELLDGKEIHNDQYELQINDSTRQVAQDLYTAYGIDAEYIHIYIHCMEKIDILHGGRIVHRDIKPDVFMNCASVIIDFSHSWSWEDGKDEPCLDPFRRRQGPATFESHSKGERDSFRRLVTDEHSENRGDDSLRLPPGVVYVKESRSHFREPTLRNRVPFLRDCPRCQQAVKDIISSADMSRLEQPEQEGATTIVQIVSTE